MSTLSLIIKREFNAKVRNKSFIVMTFLSPIIFAAVIALIVYVGSLKADVKQIAVHDESGVIKGELKNSDEYRYVDLSTVDLKTLRDSVTSEFYEGLLYIPKTDSLKALEKKVEFISNDSPSAGFIGSLENTIGQKLTYANFEGAKLDTAAISKATIDIDINLTKSTGEKSVKGLNEIKIGIGFMFGYLIMMFIIIYGNMVMRSVIEEKTNRIIEIIISSVKPFQLMMGKIIGTSLAGVLQFLIWAIVGVGLMMAGTAFFGVDASPTAGMSPEVMAAAEQNMGTAELYIREMWNLPIATLVVSFIVFFIGGYFLYSSLYAAIGAAVDNETDSQQFLLPIIMPLIVAIYIGFVTVINDPHGNIATAFSMVPFTSPIVMLMRIPFGVPVWQIVLSMVLLFGTFLGIVWFAGKIYRVGILMYGKKPSWKEIMKWINY
ncbi:ABC transporter permease [Flavobacterium caeni]|uniref:ABC-2 type transport system permease protein n=1 Tax=Flavobacterium caeni TaxID=490189 RepID=A0A1G5AJ63_9FLAO|nr:ABC transporter permease [Flavobacterium caeni]SCX77931.1 ABC-2 type transport system permease protein [Flavobacterium caeni]